MLASYWLFTGQLLAGYQLIAIADQSYLGGILQDQQINRTLEQRVVTYYNYRWLRTKGVDPNSLFDGLPLSLKAEVALDLYQDMINKVRQSSCWRCFEGVDSGKLVKCVQMLGSFKARLH